MGDRKKTGERIKNKNEDARPWVKWVPDPG